MGGVFAGLLGCGKHWTPHPSAWRIVAHPTAGFNVQIPPEWSENSKSKFFQLVAPNDHASVTISAYRSGGNPFADFVEHRFQAVEDLYRQTDERRIQEPPEMVVRQYQGIWPNETSTTLYVVACINLRDVYVSSGLVTTPEYYREHEAELQKILRSINRNSEPPVGSAGKPAPQP